MIRQLVLAAALLLVGSYYFFPAQFAPLLVFLQRRLSGLKRKSLTVDGRTFSYLDRGRGAAVVMLHEFGANSDHWLRMASSLVKRYRVLAPDLPGFGGTSASSAERFLMLERPAEVLRHFETFIAQNGLSGSFVELPTTEPAWGVGAASDV